jgi:hypothetical protein
VLIEGVQVAINRVGMSLQDSGYLNGIQTIGIEQNCFSPPSDLGVCRFFHQPLQPPSFVGLGLMNF